MIYYLNYLILVLPALQLLQLPRMQMMVWLVLLIPTHISFQLQPLNLIILMFKMLRLLSLPPVKLPKWTLFNLHWPVKINQRKEEVRIRRVKIIIKMSKLKPLLLKIGISTNHGTLALSVVMITTWRIVLDVPRLLSSFKERRNLYAASLVPTLPVSTTGSVGDSWPTIYFYDFICFDVYWWFYEK